MDNQVFMSNEGIVEIKVVGNQTVRSVTTMGQQASHLLQEVRAASKPALLLDNIFEMGEVPADARKLVIELGKQLPYDRCAMLGKGGILRLGANLMLQAMGRGGHIKYFSDREEALRWLQAKTAHNSQSSGDQ